MLHRTSEWMTAKPSTRQLLVDQHWPKTRWVEFVLICATDSHILHILPIVESITYVFSMPPCVGAPSLRFFSIARVGDRKAS